MRLVLLLLFSSSAWGWTLIGPGINGWEARTLLIWVNPTGCLISQDQLYSHVDAAIALWNRIPTSGLTLARVPEAATDTAATFSGGTATQVPLILCETNFTSAIGDADVIPAATVVPATGTGPLRTAAIYLNAESGAGAEISGLSSALFQIALSHEMGHMLGLGHSSVQQSLMYFSISGKTEARLTEDDMQGITWLYPRNELAAGTFGCAAAHGKGEPWWVGAALAYLLALIGLGRRGITPGRLRESRARHPEAGLPRPS